MEAANRWYHLVAWFFGGAFLANAIPHLVNGISGSPFQSPFASPPGQGLSSATVNVLWGTSTWSSVTRWSPASVGSNCAGRRTWSPSGSGRS